MLEHRDLTEQIIGLVFQVRRRTGPGLLEAVYAAYPKDGPKRFVA